MSDQLSNPKWQAEARVLKKLQLHFTFQPETLRRIKLDAAEDNLNTSDVLRKILGLHHEKQQRPRIGLSFTPSELEQLAQQFGVDATDSKAIKSKVVERVTRHYSSD